MFWRSNIQKEGGPFKVLLKKGEFVDTARGDRIVPYKIYHPSEYSGSKIPVLLWSHGFGGNRDGAGFISRFVASYGYVIVHMSHHGTDSSLWEGQPGHPWDILRKIKISRETTLQRFEDVPFVLDSLQGWAEENPDVGAFMDMEALGISGHSFGAMTTQVIAGQMFPDEAGRLRSYKDSRFKAGILYSPVPVRHLLGDEPESDIYGPIDLPLFHMTGTQDDSPLEGFDYERRLVVYEYGAHPEKFLLIKKGGDHMVYNGTRGKLGRNELRARHEEIINMASLAYWDAQLKGDEKAKDWLVQGGFKVYLGEDGEYRLP